MNVHSSVFWLPKEGNSIDEYEDAFPLNANGVISGDELFFAVADGASEGMLSGEWAQILVKSFCRKKNYHENNIDFLERAYKAWDAWLKNYFLQRAKRKKPIQWFEEEGFRNGAFSTFLGLKLTYKNKDQGIWEAIAIGDSCIFHVKNDSLTASFPITHSDSFNNTPFLIPSSRNSKNDLLHVLKYIKGDFSVDDQFYLMTDALACWFLAECESNGSSWKDIRDFDTEDSEVTFQEWVSVLRMTKRMRNDDVTLLRIEIL